MKEKLVECRDIALLLEILPQEERSICGTSLGVLDQLCNTAHGRSIAYDHALTMPIIVEKILQVSYLETEFRMSILWTIFHYLDNPSVVLEALQEGLFKKLLVLMQVSCRQKIRKKSFTIPWAL